MASPVNNWGTIPAGLEQLLPLQAHASGTIKPATASAPVDDTIALSLATNLLQQAATAGEQVRLERILQLKTAIETEQYQIDPLVVGRALIETRLRGE